MRVFLCFFGFYPKILIILKYKEYQGTKKALLKKLKYILFFYTHN
jgi:hypothetical protein